MSDSSAAMALTELPDGAAVIDALGGLPAVASLTSTPQKPVSYKAVHNWKASGAFPPRTYLVMTTALRERGFYAPPALWGMTAEPARLAR